MKLRRDGQGLRISQSRSGLHCYASALPDSLNYDSRPFWGVASFRPDDGFHRRSLVWAFIRRPIPSFYWELSVVFQRATRCSWGFRSCWISTWAEFLRRRPPVPVLASKPVALFQFEIRFLHSIPLFPFHSTVSFLPFLPFRLHSTQSILQPFPTIPLHSDSTKTRDLIPPRITHQTTVN